MLLAANLSREMEGQTGEIQSESGEFFNALCYRQNQFFVGENIVDSCSARLLVCRRSSALICVCTATLGAFSCVV